MDRRFLGTLAMIGIISTAIGTVIFGRASPASYSVLFYEYPKVGGRGMFSAEREIEHLTFGLVVNEPVSSVKVSYSYLREIEETHPPEEVGVDSTLDIARQTGLIPWMMNLSNFPISQGWGPEEFEIDADGMTYQLWLFDFSNVTLWAEEPEPSMPIIHGVLFEEGGNFSGYYVGAPGYLGWGGALQSLTIAIKSEEEKYSVTSKGAQPAGTRPIAEAPANGIIGSEDLEKDDLMSIDLALDPSKLAQGSYVQIVRLNIDGRTEEVFVTTLLNQY
jgi:hypothetical protein